MKKMICLVMCLIALALAVPTSALNAPLAAVSSISCEAGETVAIEVVLSKNSGFASLALQIGYDSTAMTLTGVTPGAVGGSYMPSEKLTADPYVLIWASAADITYNGVLATLEFAIKDGTTAGEYPITVTYYHGKDGTFQDGEDVNYRANDLPLGLTYQNGYVRVTSTQQVVHANGVSLDRTTLELQVEDTAILTAAVTPEDAAEKSVTWSSLAPTVAKVNNGVVTGISAGTATIVARTTDGGFEAFCTVTVKENTAPLTDNPAVTVSTETGGPGKTVLVELSLSKNSGFASLALQIGYDSSAMTLTGVTPGEVGGSYMPSEKLTADPYVLIWASAADITYNGMLATLEFAIKDGTAAGEYPVTVTYYHGKDGSFVDGEDVNYNASDLPLELTYHSGGITIAGLQTCITGEITRIPSGGYSLSYSAVDCQSSTAVVVAAFFDNRGRMLFPVIWKSELSGSIPITDETVTEVRLFLLDTGGSLCPLAEAFCIKMP